MRPTPIPRLNHSAPVPKLLLSVPVLQLLTACAGPQSALDPAGPNAHSLHVLGVVMYVGAAVVTLLVTALMLYPLFRRRRAPPSERVFLWGGGVALPSLALAALVPFVMATGSEMRQPTSRDRITVDITGYIYWWEMAYRRAGGGVPAVTANELRIPVGEPVELLLGSADVIHSFWVPSLAGKTDMIPGRINRMVIQADRPGVWRGQCAEFCGAQHALMAFDVIAVPRAELDAWIERLATPVRQPADPELLRGRDLFMASGCGSCHTVRGLSDGRRGPDLTNVGSRLSLAAGSMPNNVGTLAGWTASAQHLKPGSLMPSFGNFTGPELRALAAYMEALR
jgi:cytochrome c oxidase subunit 2